jgi:hypothetical protein
MRRLEENPIRGADDIGPGCWPALRAERSIQPDIPPERSTSVKALLIAIEVGACLGIVAAIIIARFLAVW